MTEPIRLGLMAPLTGLVSMYGADICHAARIACDEINEAGGLLGRPLELLIEDDGSLPVTAVPAALRLVDERGCVAVVGNLLSNSRIAVAAQVAEARHIPMLNFSCSEGSISGRHFFHFAALPNQQVDSMLPYFGEHYGLKMYLAGNNYEWPRGSLDAFKRTLKRLGGEVVGEEYLPFGASVEEVDGLLRRVGRSGADVFVPYFAGSDQMTLLTRFTALGLKPRVAVVMAHYDEVMVSRLAPAVRAGLYATSSYFMTVDTAENRNFLARLARQPGVAGLWPEGNGMQSSFGEGAYVCVHAFARAVKAAGGTAPEALVTALEQVRLRAPQGDIVMDAATHHAHVNNYLARCRPDGSFAIVEAYGAIAPSIPERYRQQAAAALKPDAPLGTAAIARLAADVRDAMHEMGTAKQILSMANMAIVATDAGGQIVEANEGACRMFGYTADELMGMSVHELLPPHMRGRHAHMVQGFVEGERSEARMAGQREITGYRKDGSFFPIEATIAKVRLGQSWMLVATMRDITVQKRSESELQRQSTCDALTGLPNRALIRERLGSALARSQRSRGNVGLLFVGLDGFKLINDAHGHDAGDALLKSIAARLLDQMRPGDILARLSGDEFAILCEHLDAPSELAAVAEGILAALRQPTVFDNTALTMTASIGAAFGHGSSHSVDDMMRSADTAMHAVKEKGRDGWQLFSTSLQVESHQRLAVTQGLRTAIANGEFSACFQPIVGAGDGRIAGAELLLRWHPAGGEVAPGVFIPIAESSGAIVAIGAWVFRRGCQAQADWQRRWGAQAPAYISVNVSTRQLNEADLVDTFSAILRETGADPARILIEITETALMADVETNLRVLRQLAGLGLRVAVDDFGTGYSSLAQLTRLPVGVLKIDKAFIDGIESQQESRTVVRAIIGLGRALGLQLVAEGVENAAQLAELRGNGCDFIQGYLFHRPLDEPAFLCAYDAQASMVVL